MAASTSANAASNPWPAAEPTSGNTAKPIDAEIEIVLPSTITGASTKALINRCASTTPSATGIVSTITRNSSPPQRTTTSRSAQHAFEAARDLLEHGVAGGVAEAVVDVP